MADILQMELEERLVEWSYWSMGITGFPKNSAIVGIGLPVSKIRYSKPPYPLNNERACEMNGWINIMGNRNREYKEAIKLYYLSSHNIKIWQIAQQLKISTATFKKRLQLARTWLSGCLAARIENDENYQVCLAEHTP